MSVYTNSFSSTPAEVQQYIQALQGLAGDDKPLTALAKADRSIRSAIRGLTKRQLARREKPGKWSIAHVIQHLADSELVYAWRYRMILAHDKPAIQGYDQDLWADRLGYDATDVAAALEQFRALRNANLRLLKRVKGADLDRYGVHSERGQESVAQLMRLNAGHDRLHLNQIKRIRASI